MGFNDECGTYQKAAGSVIVNEIRPNQSCTLNLAAGITLLINKLDSKGAVEAASKVQESVARPLFSANHDGDFECRSEELQACIIDSAITQVGVAQKCAEDINRAEFEGWSDVEGEDLLTNLTAGLLQGERLGCDNGDGEAILALHVGAFAQAAALLDKVDRSFGGDIGGVDVHGILPDHSADLHG
jgi:hypothetical protein